ncbi:MAG: STAS domain-containing protein [Chitinophagales bacterium]
MNFNITEQENFVIIALKGKLIGQHQIATIIDDIEDKIADEKTHFIAELSEVQLINSTGLGVLLSILTKARNAGGELILANLSEQIKKLLIVTKLNAIFTIEPNLEKAIEKLTALKKENETIKM